MSLEIKNNYELISSKYKISTEVKIAKINSCVDTSLVYKYLELEINIL